MRGIIIKIRDVECPIPYDFAFFDAETGLQLNDVVSLDMHLTPWSGVVRVKLGRLRDVEDEELIEEIWEVKKFEVIK